MAEWMDHKIVISELVYLLATLLEKMLHCGK